MAKRKKKWAVEFPDGRYVTDVRTGKGIAWTYDKKEADRTAESFGGSVVDAYELQARVCQLGEAESLPPATRHPMQPVERAADTSMRFKKNVLVSQLLSDASFRGFDLNTISASTHYSAEDKMQLLQLIGYSVAGYGNVPFVTPESVAEADAAVAAFFERHRERE